MTCTALLDLFRQREARVAGPDEAPFLLTLGGVPAEYTAAREACVVFDATDGETLVASGADAQGFLHRLLANDVKLQPDGTRRENLLLSPKGKVRFQLALERRGEACLLAVRAGEAKALHDALEMYHFSEQVAFARDDGEARLELCGPRAHALLAPGFPGLDADLARGAVVAGALDGVAGRAAPAAVAGSAGFVLCVPRAQAAAAVAALEKRGARLAGRVVRDILRVEACQAEPGVDVDDTIYPQEARLERAFALDKGCYIGQEVVAKIDTYGGLNKRLVALKIGHDDPLPRGTRLVRLDEGERRELGVVTSWSWSFVLDTGLALAYVKRRHQAPGTVFELEGGATATIVAAPVRPDALPVTGGAEG